MIYALPRQDLRLAIERAGDRHWPRPPPTHGRPPPRSGCRPRSPRRRRCLHDNARAGTAGQARTPRHVAPCAGTTSRRSDVCTSPITVMVARQHGHAVSSGASVTSIPAGAGSAPWLARRLAALRSGSRFSRLRVFLAIACSRASRASCRPCPRQTLRSEGRNACVSYRAQQVTQPVILCRRSSR